MISRLPGLDGKTVSVPVDDVIRQFGEGSRLGVASNSYVSAANARPPRLVAQGAVPREWLQSLAQSRPQAS